MKSYIVLFIILFTTAYAQDWPWTTITLPKNEFLPPEDITGTWYISAIYKHNAKPACVCGKVEIDNKFVDEADLKLTIKCYNSKLQEDENSEENSIESYIVDLANDQNTEWIAQNGQRIDIVDFDRQNYNWMMLGWPNYKELMIISRNTPLDPDVIQFLIHEAKIDGFNITPELYSVNLHIGCPPPLMLKNKTDVDL